MQEDKLLMNRKERDRKVMFEYVKQGQLTLKEASERLSLSYRQTRRQYRSYRLKGDSGLIHKSRGRVSNCQKDPLFKKKVIKLYKSTYEGFGPTFASEKLKEKGYEVHHETLRLWLKKEGLWIGVRERSPYRQQRKRKECFGELLQLDGSIHEWFGETGGFNCLMNLVDDATGKAVALLAEGETTEAALKILKSWVLRYGIPKAVYVDLKTVYVSPGTHKNEDGELSEGFTHFSRVCEKLGIKIIKAYSPQAKGRVERKHAVFQDRFVKELKLRKIKSIEKANEFLESFFLEEINQKFEKEPFSKEDAHRDPKIYDDLEQIFCWEFERMVHKDWTISFQSKYYQILKSGALLVRPKNKVKVRVHLNGNLSLWHKDFLLDHRLLEQKPLKVLPEKLGPDILKISKRATKNRFKTPWGRFDSLGIKKEQSKQNNLP